MPDNASVHTAHIIKALLANLGVEVMDGPAYSPDLNLIENLWSLMKREIYRLAPDLANAADTNKILDRLIVVAQEAWHAIDMEILCNLSDSMPRHVNAIIGANEWFTQY
jgi:hypothetical protein